MAVIDTGLPHFGRPTEWATMAKGFLFTTAVPVKPDGTFETGSAQRQIEVTIANVRKILAAAGGALNNILQVIVYLTNEEHIGALNEEWARQFVPPFPNRGIVIVNAIGVPGIVTLFQIHAYIEDKAAVDRV